MSQGPFSVNGVGWKHYGQRDFGPDGSFITTEWFVVFHFPIFPLRSRRLIKHGRENVIGPFYQKEHYSAARSTRPDLKQVACIYVYTLAFIGLITYLILNFNELTRQLGAPVIVGGTVVGWVIFMILPGLLRAQAMRRVGLKRVRRKRR